MKEIENKGYEFSVKTGELISHLSQYIPNLISAALTGKEDDIIVAIIPFVSVFTCIDIKSSKGRLLNKFIENSLKKATVDVLKLIPREKLRLWDRFKINHHIKSHEDIICVDQDLFNRPGESQVSHIYLENLCAALELIDEDITEDIQTIKINWKEIFSKAISEEWSSDRTYATELTCDLVFGPMQDYIDALESEKAYKQKIISLMNEKIFNESCSLEDIYVSLSAECCFGKSKQRSGIICNLDEHLLSWSLETKTGMVIVEGDPGSGKSTVLKKVAKDLIEHGKNVVYVNLYKVPFSVNTDSIQTLIEYISKKNDWYKILGVDISDDTIYIFDGLDEIRYDVWDNAKNLTRQLFTLYDTQKVILSGRTRIIEHCSIELDKFDKYTISPLCCKIENPIVEFDKRNVMWSKLMNVFKIKTQLNELISMGNLDELSSNPLLLFLLAWTFSNRPSSVEKISNSVQLYRQILECVYERKHNRKENDYAGSSIEYQSYFRILSAIGACAWQNNSREICISQIKDYCQKMNLEKEFKKWFDYEKETQTSKLFLLFFAHENQLGDESTFEFLHKSFYEFLAVEEIMFQIGEIAKMDKANGTERLCRLLCKRYADSDSIYYFIQDLISTDIEAFSDYTINLKYAFSLIDISSIDNTFENSNIANPLLESAKLSDANEKLDYIRKNMWRLVGYIFTTQKKNPTLRNVNHFNFKNVDFVNHMIQEYELPGICFEVCVFDDITMPIIDFKEGEFRKSSFINCVFPSTIFDSCILNDVIINSSNLEAASFCKAQIVAFALEGNGMEGTYFCDAQVMDSTFDDCILISANFDDASFTNCSFEECNFTRADFIRVLAEKNCKYKECRFENADLTETEFIDVSFEACAFANAELNCVRFIRGSMEDCSFKNANLNRTEFKSIKMKHCDFGNSKLYGSQFISLYLECCSFNDTDLSKTNFYECIFKNCTFENAIMTNVPLSLFDLDDEETIYELSKSNLNGACWNGVPNEVKNKILGYSSNI